jgi:hypothetical protein
MFNGCFHGLDKHQLLALVSCLTPCDKTNEEVAIVQQLADPLRQLQVRRFSLCVWLIRHQLQEVHLYLIWDCKAAGSRLSRLQAGRSEQGVEHSVRLFVVWVSHPHR